MLTIGNTYTLTAERETAAGYFLGDGEGNQALLPLSLAERPPKIGEQLKVFVYGDAEGKLIASPHIPYAQAGDFVYLRVADVQEFGAFLDWGLEKDLLVPYSQQKEKMVANEFYVVYIHVDHDTNRLIGSSRLENFISLDIGGLEEGQEVDVLVYEESPLGFSAIINNRNKGLIYHSDIFKDVSIGDELKGYVKRIREDGLIDLSFQKSGFKNVLDSTEVVLDYLQRNDGFINLHDKSSPEEISIRLSMSKATYKKAIGILYRQRKVLITPEGVRLVQPS